MSASPTPGKLVVFLLTCVALDVEEALSRWRVGGAELGVVLGLVLIVLVGLPLLGGLNLG